MKTKSHLLLTAAACAVLTVPASAANWYVSPAGGGGGTAPGSPGDLALALSMAAPGDTVYFSAGTYNLGTSPALNFAVFGKNLNLVGVLGGAVVLDMAAAAGNISIAGGARVTMSDMILQNGTLTSCVVVNLGSHLELVRSTVYLITAPQAVLVTGTSTARFEDCIFHMNTKGLSVSSNSDVEVERCLFTNNTSAAVYLTSAGAATRIVDSTFANNTGGVRVAPSGADTGSTIEGNYFNANGTAIALASTAAAGAGVCRDKVWANEIRNSTVAAISSGTGTNTADIEANWLDSNKKGIYLERTRDLVHNNVVINSISGGTGGNGIEARQAGAVVAYNTVAYNGRDGLAASYGDTSLWVNNISISNGSHGLRSLSSPGARVGNNNTFANPVNLGGAYVSLGGHLAVNPGFAGAYDFHLTATSPMIDAANTALFMDLADFDGKPRPAGAADIGAFER